MFCVEQKVWKNVVAQEFTMTGQDPGASDFKHYSILFTSVWSVHVMDGNKKYSSERRAVPF